jgi:uncharacterized membrane protein
MPQLTASRQGRLGRNRRRVSRRPTDVLDILKPFLTGLVTLLALDLAWIGLVANQFYKRELAGLARMDGDNFAIRLGPALVLYPLMILGLQIFVLPRVEAGQPLAAAMWGGLFGLVGYGIYDLTNYATLASTRCA